FVTENKLYETLESNNLDQEIQRAFLRAPLPLALVDELKLVLRSFQGPIAVRSSSLLEDSQFQPFAGIYATYMLPNNNPESEIRLSQLVSAIKHVYASAFLLLPRTYLDAIGLKIEEEKMAIVIQHLAGNLHGQNKRYYPDFSGVAQSYNFYPFTPMQPDDGIAHIAIGLGKTVVEGGNVLRFCPKYPHVLPQFVTPRSAVSLSQRDFYCLDMTNRGMPELWKDDSITLLKQGLEIAEEDGVLGSFVSTYDPNDDLIRDGIHEGPRVARVVTFAGVLKYDLFPLAQILERLMSECSAAMGCAVEIEFAVNLKEEFIRIPIFYILQARPMVTEFDFNGIEIKKDSLSNAAFSTRALGNGITRELTEVVIVRLDTFDNLRTRDIASEIASFNDEFEKSGKKYVLVGPGRWGSNDPFLGIPVRFSDISQAKCIIEIGLKDFYIDPSYGSHFFSNLVSSQICYLCIPAYQTKGTSAGEDYIRWEFLEKGNLVKE
ncbi:MAG TPA: PEP/pyruvate-binding domain-containing protein, partial [Candidatus Hodarchaeales archaeon]|nr:PEP/pyruvate-binding domain-containing protein [Candidatus Hodarchaeales archaeon]